MRLISTIGRLLPDYCREFYLKGTRAGIVSAKKAREAETRERREMEIAGIKSKLPKDLTDKLRSDLKYTNWRTIWRNHERGFPPPKFCIDVDPLTVIPENPKVCVKALSVAKRKTGSRNYTGSICTRRIGGGHKRRIRLLDRHKKTTSPQKVVRIEYDPNRSAKLMLLQDTMSGRLSYRVAAEGVAPGQIIVDSLREDTDIKSSEHGACVPLRLIPLGAKIHDVETRPNGGGKMVKSAGTFAILIGHMPNKPYSIVKMPSGETKQLHKECRASMGVVGNAQWHLRVIGKAGRNRNLGIRPHVRGVAMNAVDHPHGGGKGGRGKGKPSQSPWGKICK